MHNNLLMSRFILKSCTYFTFLSRSLMFANRLYFDIATPTNESAVP